MGTLYVLTLIARMRFPASERSRLFFKFNCTKGYKRIRTFSDFDSIYSSQGCLEYAFICFLFFSMKHLCTINKHLAVGVSVDVATETIGVALINE